MIDKDPQSAWIESACHVSMNQGWTGKLFFSRGGAGRGGARPKIFGAGKGSKSAGNTLLISAD